MFVFLDATDLRDFQEHWRSVAASYAASARLHQREWDDGASVILAKALDALAALPQPSVHARFDAPTLHVIFARLTELCGHYEDDLRRLGHHRDANRLRTKIETVRSVQSDLHAFVRAHELRHL